MKKAAIGIDAWKLPIFEDELTKAGFTLDNKGPFTHGTLILTVYTETIAKLQPVIEAANQRALRERATLTREGNGS